jgi:hypothetical protein
MSLFPCYHRKIFSLLQLLEFPLQHWKKCLKWEVRNFEVLSVVPLWHCSGHVGLVMAVVGRTRNWKLQDDMHWFIAGTWYTDVPSNLVVAAFLFGTERVLPMFPDLLKSLFFQNFFINISFVGYIGVFLTEGWIVGWFMKIPTVYLNPWSLKT